MWLKIIIFLITYGPRAYELIKALLAALDKKPAEVKSCLDGLCQVAKEGDLQPIRHLISRKNRRG